MKPLIAIGTTLCVVTWVLAQDQDEKKLRAVLKAQAKDIGQAMVEDKHHKLIDGTYPKLVELIGGREAMTELLEKLSKQMRAQWPTRSVKTDEPTTVVKGKDASYGVVPFTLEMKSATARVAQ